MANYTWAQLEEFLGTPIILLSFWRADIKREVEVTVTQLPPAVQTAVLQWINNHLP